MKLTQAEAMEALERLWMARDLTHPDAMIMWYDIIHTSLTQSAAEIERLHKENDVLRAACANGNGECVYCRLPRSDWQKCKSGFPGCARADDVMLCPHVGAELESSAEIERLKQREADLLAANNSYLERARAAEEQLARAEEVIRPFAKCSNEWKDFPSISLDLNVQSPCVLWPAAMTSDNLIAAAQWIKEREEK